MPASVGVAVQVAHFAGESEGQPVAQAVEVVSGGGWGNAYRVESQSPGLHLQSRFKGVHVLILVPAAGRFAKRNATGGVDSGRGRR